MKNTYKTAALRAADWFVNTQNNDLESADYGRYLYAVNLKTGERHQSTGWQTAFGVFALLSAHKASRDHVYLNSAAKGIDYIKSLQILDSRLPRYYGAIREETPQTTWLHPRDALSAAWAFLGYHQAVGESDALERAVLFADWMLRYAFIGDWPLCTICLGKGEKASDDLSGSFQSGGILFFLEMFKATQNLLYYDVALRMADYYVDNFIGADGLINCLVDKIGNNDLAKWPIDWQRMHQVNDDFGGISLVAAFNVYKKEIYRSRCSAYLMWLESMVNLDGSFLTPVVEVGSATVPIFLKAFHAIASEEEQKRIEVLTTKCLAYLLSVQQTSENPEVAGAFLGMDNNCRYGLGDWINIRCTSYAAIALLQQQGLSAFPVFGGPAEPVKNSGASPEALRNMISPYDSKSKPASEFQTQRE